MGFIATERERQRERDLDATYDAGVRDGRATALHEVLETAEVYFATDKATRNLLAGLIKRVKEQAS